MIRALHVLVVLCSMAAVASAQNLPPKQEGESGAAQQREPRAASKPRARPDTGMPERLLRVTAAATGPRTSPFEPPEASDVMFIVDGAGGLDTGCTFRSGGPLVFDVEITRWVGPVDGSGKLLDPAALIAAGVLSPTASIALPAFDVDVNGAPGFPPEVDQISLNGKVLGTLTGDNDTWKLNQFTVDIADLRFPDRAPLGSTPTPAMNTFRIDIDTASGGDENWCTSVDWATVNFKAVSPVILTHGNNSDAGFWDRHNFSAVLAAAHIPFDGCANTTRCRNPINLPTDFVAANGARLATIIPDIVRTFGADSFHVVAHSKGGLDSREFLANHLPGDLTLLSHNTLSTPHNGSVLADITVARGVSLNILRSTRFVGFPAFTQTLVFLSNLTGPDNGARNLTTTFTAGFNAGNVGALPPADYNQVAADADRNGSASIDIENEIAALRRDDGKLNVLPTFLATRIVDPLYQILRTTSGITTSTSWVLTFIGGVLVPTQVLTITAVPTAGPLGNDVLVTIPSGLGAGSIAARSTATAVFTGGAGRNHSDVADAGVAALVIPWLFSAERTRGDLK
jgi:triacylglycerol lipase